MVEIYNEELRDLLAPINGKQRKQQSLQVKVISAHLRGSQSQTEMLIAALPCSAAKYA